jgi:hypothetical protein
VRRCAMRRLAWSFILLAACAEEGPPAWPGEDLPACETTRTSYVIDELRLGQEEDGSTYGVDFSGDGERDNQLQLLVRLVHNQLHFDPQARTDDALASDALLIGVTIETCDGQYRLVELHRGVAIDRAASPPRLTVEPVTTLAAVQRPIRFDRLAEAGTTRFPPTALFEAEGAAWIDAFGFSADLYTVDDDEVDGVLAGGLEPAQFFAAATPLVHREVVARIAEDPGCPDACTDDTAQSLLGVFDIDDDGTVTLAEVETNAIVTGATAADVDLRAEVDGVPTYWPLHDDVRDSLSFGLGFHAERVDVVE